MCLPGSFPSPRHGAQGSSRARGRWGPGSSTSRLADPKSKSVPGLVRTVRTVRLIRVPPPPKRGYTYGSQPSTASQACGRLSRDVTKLIAPIWRCRCRACMQKPVHAEQLLCVNGVPYTPAWLVRAMPHRSSLMHASTQGTGVQREHKGLALAFCHAHTVGIPI
jgi:hypothetical protein